MASDTCLARNLKLSSNDNERKRNVDSWLNTMYNVHRCMRKSNETVRNLFGLFGLIIIINKSNKSKDERCTLSLTIYRHFLLSFFLSLMIIRSTTVSVFLQDNQQWFLNIWIESICYGVDMASEKIVWFIWFINNYC